MSRRINHENRSVSTGTRTCMRWLLILIGFMPLNIEAQCLVDSLYGERINISENDNPLPDSTRLRLLVTNTTGEGDLDPGSLCAVRINFRHTNITDLLMTLISPSGKEITLIGPATGTGDFNFVFPILHDISFVRLDSATSPDPGFNSVWDNLNSTWGDIGQYTGDYFPNNGFLDDLTEPVDGVWELFVEDLFLNHVGRIDEWELIFCGPGVICSECEPLPGQFFTTIDTICNSESISLLDYYDPSVISSDEYEDIVLIYSEDTLVNVQQTYLVNLPVGAYEVYIANLLTEQIDSFLSDDLIFNKTSMLADLGEAGGQYCALLSNPMNLVSNQPLDSEMRTFFICPNDSIVFEGEIIYGVVDTLLIPSSSCDIIYFVETYPLSIHANVLGDSIINCDRDTVFLRADNTNNSDATNFEWLDHDRDIIGIGDIYGASSPGTYYLVVGDGNCTDTAVHVLRDEQELVYIRLFADTTVLYCAKPEVKIYPEFSLYAGNEIIAYDGGVTGRIGDTLLFNEGGWITATLSSTQSSCIAVDSVFITVDTLVPELSPFHDTLSCTKEQVLIGFLENPVSAVRYEWYDETGAFMDSVRNPLVTEGGRYDLIAMYPNTCSSFVQVEIFADTSQIEVFGIPARDTLSCLEDMILFEPFFDEDLTHTFLWLNQGGDTIASTSEIGLSTPGQYTFVVEGRNGCRSERNLMLDIDTIRPSIDVLAEDITCASPNATIEAIPDDAAYQYLWTGPGVGDEVSSRITVSETGKYYVQTIDITNGCTSLDSTFVLEDFSKPDIALIPNEGEISCGDPNASVNIITGPSNTGFWIRMSGDTLQTRFANLTTPGTHYFYTQGRNGCTTLDSVIINGDFDPPYIPIDTFYVLDCNNTNYTLSIPDTISLLAREWIFTSGDRLMQNSVTIEDVFLDRLETVGLNGCRDTLVFDIRADFEAPLVSVTAPPIGCDNPTTTISVLPDEDDYTYSWDGGEISGFTANFPQVSTAGNYAVEVLDMRNGCSENYTVEVTGNMQEPVYTVGEIPALDCRTTQSFLWIAPQAGSSVQWIDDGGNTFDGDSLMITTGGQYFVEITGANNCSVLDSFLVAADFTAPEFTLDTFITLTCDLPGVLLQPVTGDSLEFVEWYLRDGSITRSVDFLVEDDQLLRVVAGGLNGCTSESFITIDIDQSEPDIFVTGNNTIDCDNPFASLTAMSSLSAARFTWSGGNLAAVPGDSISVDQGAVYRVTATNPGNGCTNTDSITVTENVDLPRLVVPPDTDLTCNFPIQSLTASGDLGNAIVWTLTDGTEVSADSIVVSMTGVYRVRTENDAGCVRQDSVIVTENVDAPSISIDTTFRINCAMPSVALSIPSDDTVSSVAWVFDDNSIVNGPDIVLDGDDIQRVIVTGTNGCVNQAFLTVAVDTAAPLVSVTGDTITCTRNSVTLSAMTDDDPYLFHWRGGNMTGANTSNITTSQGGLYVVTVTDTSNMCADSASYFVVQDDNLPVFAVSADTVVSCAMPLAELAISTAEELLVNWTAPDGTTVFDSMLTTELPGPYVFQVSNDKGCTVTDTVLVRSDLQAPVVDQSFSYMLTCDQDQISVELDSLGELYSIVWKRSDGSSDTSATTVITSAGPVVVTFTGANGCDAEFPVSVAFDTVAPGALLTISDTLLCQPSGIDLEPSDFNASYEYRWSSQGVLLGNDPILAVMANGLYSLQVRNPRNGCTSRDSSLVTYSQRPIRELAFTATDERCTGLADGSIQVDSVRGGVGELELLLDDLPLGNQRDSLGAGNYVLSVVDELGCQFDTSFEISAGITLDVELGEDLAVFENDPVSIDASTTGGITEAALRWFVNGEEVENNGRDVLNLNPSVNSTVLAILETPDGCVASDTLQIEVFLRQAEVTLYVPDVIYLSSAQGNQRLTVRIPDGAAQLDFFRVFDRWGEMVAEMGTTSDPGDIFIWDGKLNGKNLVSGVYVYIYQLTANDGTKSLVWGDLTVIN